MSDFFILSICDYEGNIVFRRRFSSLKEAKTEAQWFSLIREGCYCYIYDSNHSLVCEV